MSLENERHLLDQHVEFSKESRKKSRISYTREFLLALSELDACKKLPSGFDRSLLSEFEDTSQDRQRIPGTLSGYRRNEYGSSPPTGGGSGNYSRGIHGRWDTRPSGRIDRESDSQSDRDSDPGRRFGNQSRWQGPERDGLLGSGSFPRPSGYRAEASAPKSRANDQYHLNRTTEPYHPPRPYKAAPLSRRETNDSFNDETFGSTECTNEDRAEEERKRRASFESWRKEALQEKKINPERPKGDFDISELLVESKDDKGLPNTSKELEEPMPASNIDFDKSSRPPQAPASRPLVPPGFSGSILERNLGTKIPKHSHPSQVGSPEIDGSLTDAKGILLLNGTSDGDLLGKHSKQHVEETFNEQQLETTGIHLLADNKSGKAVNFSSALDKPNERLSVDSQLYKSSSISEAFEVPGSPTVTEPHSKNLVADKLLTKTNQDGRSTSILDKLFVSALTPNEGGSSNFTEHNDSKPDEILAPDSFLSSKFAHLFLEEENKKPVDDLSTGRPKDLLSLFHGGEKGVAVVSDELATTHVTPNFPFQIPGLADGRVVSNLTSPGIENSEQSSNTNNVNKPTAVPSVLTCEDLEKSILSESIENDPVLPPAVEGWKIVDAQTKKQEVNVDDHASQHLLSLLQNKTSMKSVKSSTSLDIKSSERVQDTETGVDSAPCDPIEVNAENASGSGKSLTLEALFGSAFMKELQSVGDPASIHRGSMESARVDALESNRLPLHVADDGVLPSSVHIGSNRTTFETNILPFSQREQIKPDGIEEHFLGYNYARSAMGSSHLRAELGGARLGDLDRSAEIQFPEEDILIGGSNPRHLHNFMAGNVKAGQFPSQETPVDVADKLAALKGVFRDERAAVGQPGLYDMREPDILFHNQNVQPSSPQLRPQLNHGGSLIHSLDSHPSNINPLMKFMAAEGILRRDAAPNHQFPASMLRPPFHHPSSGPIRFDPPKHHPMLQQMPIPGNFPPPHLQQGFPRGAPLPPHIDMPEVNPMHGFPFGHGQRQPQPNFAGLGMPPGHDAGGGSRHPEALQRLIEMQLRSSSKQPSPFGEAGNSQGMYDQDHGHNPELGMGFGYR